MYCQPTLFKHNFGNRPNPDVEQFSLNVRNVLVIRPTEIGCGSAVTDPVIGGKYLYGWNASVIPPLIMGLKSRGYAACWQGNRYCAGEMAGGSGQRTVAGGPPVARSRGLNVKVRL
jgi:hypothetical protein